MQIDFFDETVMIRGSICGHFRPSGLAWGGIWDRLLRKMLHNRVFEGRENAKIKTNGVAMPRHGLIFLVENGATASMKLLESLPGLQDLKNVENHIFGALYIPLKGE